MAQAVVSLKSTSTRPAVVTEKLGKVYPNGTRALKNVSLTIKQDEFLVIIGSSGAGKSTLLRCLNRLIQPSEGRIEIFGEDVTGVGGKKLRRIRARAGMIFQQFHLVRRLSALENVLVGRLRFNGAPLNHLASLIRWLPQSEKEAAFECMKQVGIAELAFQRADTLSGGQQQRVAIARALAQEPEIFLADEPIASLDPHSAEVVMETLQLIHEERRMPVIVNLHHIDFARRYGRRVIGMVKGEMVFDGTAEDLDQEAIARVYGSRIEEYCGQLIKKA